MEEHSCSRYAGENNCHSARINVVAHCVNQVWWPSSTGIMPSHQVLVIVGLSLIVTQVLIFIMKLSPHPSAWSECNSTVKQVLATQSNVVRELFFNCENKSVHWVVPAGNKSIVFELKTQRTWLLYLYYMAVTSWIIIGYKTAHFLSESHPKVHIDKKKKVFSTSVPLYMKEFKSHIAEQSANLAFIELSGSFKCLLLVLINSDP